MSAITKAEISNLSSPVLLKVNYATFISAEHDPNENESLLTTWDICEHGVTVNGIHPSAPKCGITVNETFMEFDWNDECVFFNISKPSTTDLDTYEVYELNSPLPPSYTSRRLPDPTRHDLSLIHI